MLKDNEDKNKTEREENRIANLKKCIHYALNVQVTKSNIEKNYETLDIINTLKNENNEFI